MSPSSFGTFSSISRAHNLFYVLLGEWEGMGHDFGVSGGRFASVSKLGTSLMFSAFSSLSPSGEIQFVVVV